MSRPERDIPPDETRGDAGEHLLHGHAPFRLGRALRRGWWAVAAAPVVAIAAAAWMTSGQQPLYRSSASLAVVPSEHVEAATDALRSLETLERRTVVATFAEVASSDRTLSAAAADLQVGTASGCVGGGMDCYRSRGSVIPNTNVIRVEVQGPNPELTAGLADGVAAVTRGEAGRFYPVFALRPVEGARPPREPVFPDLRRNLLVAGVLGLFLGGLVTVGAEVLRSRWA